MLPVRGRHGGHGGREAAEKLLAPCVGRRCLASTAAEGLWRGRRLMRWRSEGTAACRHSVYVEINSPLHYSISDAFEGVMMSVRDAEFS